MFARARRRASSARFHRAMAVCESNAVPIKVVVRCRPVAQAIEDAGASPIEVRESSREVIVNTKAVGKRRNGNGQSSDVLQFSFDGVCGPACSQKKLFQTHIQPVVEEVLKGFNCTVFAYGQTGTGKTYTIEGEWDRSLGSEPVTPLLPPKPGAEPQPTRRRSLNQADPRVRVVTHDAEEHDERPRPDLTPNTNYSVFVMPEHVGIIPRSISQIFERLNEMRCESGIRVSFLEIYNEELIDLLNEEKVGLRLYDRTNGASGSSGGQGSSSAAGGPSNPLTSGGLAVKGLREISVSTLPEVYEILMCAAKRRKTAETCLNRQSSRSHSIFTISVTIKERSPGSDGEDVIRIGKLNLVDLAGSENIQRSGTNNSVIRTKEAGLINQSLVALGRVITALANGAQSGSGGSTNYVPYRDSKLTRLLQDSLGGRTKTCVIATIALCSNAVTLAGEYDSRYLDETISTLDYAYRAKCIKNRPVRNERMTQKFVLKALTDEIDRLKKELQMARDKSGDVYLDSADYDKMQTDLLAYVKLRATHDELNTTIATLKEESEQMKGVKEEYEEFKTLHTSIVEALFEEQERSQKVVDFLASLVTSHCAKQEAVVVRAAQELAGVEAGTQQAVQTMLRAQLLPQLAEGFQNLVETVDRSVKELSDLRIAPHHRSIDDGLRALSVALAPARPCEDRKNSLDPSAGLARVQQVMNVRQAELARILLTQRDSLDQLVGDSSRAVISAHTLAQEATKTSRGLPDYMRAQLQEVLDSTIATMERVLLGTPDEFTPSARSEGVGSEPCEPRTLVDTMLSSVHSALRPLLRTIMAQVFQKLVAEVQANAYPPSVFEATNEVIQSIAANEERCRVARMSMRSVEHALKSLLDHEAPLCLTIASAFADTSTELTRLADQASCCIGAMTAAQQKFASTISESLQGVVPRERAGCTMNQVTEIVAQSVEGLCAAVRQQAKMGTDAIGEELRRDRAVCLAGSGEYRTHLGLPPAAQREACVQDESVEPVDQESDEGEAQVARGCKRWRVEDAENSGVMNDGWAG